MNCAETRDLFAAHVEGLLDPAASIALEDHLARCVDCREALDESRCLVARLRRVGRPPSSSITTAVMDRIVRQQAFRLRRLSAMKRVAARVSIAATLLVAGTLIVARPTLSLPVHAGDLSATRDEMSKVKTATWKTSFYMRYVSNDRRRSKWVRIGNSEKRYFYKAPGLYRLETLNEEGQIAYVSVENVRDRVKLDVNPGTRTATLAYLAESSYSPLGPFVPFTEAMKSKDLQSLGKKTVSGREAAGYRFAFFVDRANQNWSYEFWLDPKTKRLINGQVPGGDIFSTADVVPNMIHRPGAQTIAVDGETFTVASTLGFGMSSSGFLVHDIELGVVVDDGLFSGQPPEGYALNTIPLPTITERDVTEFLGVVAEYFNKAFPDHLPNFNSGPKEYERFELAEADVAAGNVRSDAELSMVKAMHKWWSTGIPGPGPLHVFITRKIVPGSWKYLGKGVKLGDKSAIVCWYRLDGSRSYRVIFGDLSIKDMEPDDLPLPVDK